MTAAQDKLGAEIKPGDVVEVVYGGEYHQMTVDAIADSGFGDILILQGNVTIKFPAGASTLKRHAAQPALPQGPPVGADAPVRPAPAPAVNPPTAAPGSARPTNERTNEVLGSESRREAPRRRAETEPEPKPKTAAKAKEPTK